MFDVCACLPRDSTDRYFNLAFQKTRCLNWEKMIVRHWEQLNMGEIVPYEFHTLINHFGSSSSSVNGLVQSVMDYFSPDESSQN